MRKLILGSVGAAAMALAALVGAPQGASAQGFSITFGTGHPPVVRHYDEPPRYRHRPHRYEHRRYSRPRHYRDCVIRTERYWTGYSWVTERRRICG